MISKPAGEASFSGPTPLKKVLVSWATFLQRAAFSIYSCYSAAPRGVDSPSYLASTSQFQDRAPSLDRAVTLVPNATHRELDSRSHP